MRFEKNPVPNSGVLPVVRVTQPGTNMATVHPVATSLRASTVCHKCVEVLI